MVTNRTWIAARIGRSGGQSNDPTDHTRDPAKRKTEQRAAFSGMGAQGRHRPPPEGRPGPNSGFVRRRRVTRERSMCYFAAVCNGQHQPSVRPQRDHGSTRHRPRNGETRARANPFTPTSPQRGARATLHPSRFTCDTSGSHGACPYPALPRHRGYNIGRVS